MNTIVRMWVLQLNVKTSHPHTFSIVFQLALTPELAAATAPVMETPQGNKALSLLEKLPDELLIMVASCLRPIRSFETQSEAFKWKPQESQRQAENAKRRRTLCALCLTSRRLNQIVEPTLYSAFISTATPIGLIVLQRFLRALAARPKLAENIKYIENRLSDYRGFSLGRDLDDDRLESFVAEYQYELAALIRVAPNLDHLSVVSLEPKGSLWQHLIAPHRSLCHRFPRLRTLCLQTNMIPLLPRLYTQTFHLEQLFYALFAAPQLEEISASSLTSQQRSFIVKEKSSKIKRLQLFECVLDVDEVAAMVGACTNLRSFGCSWAWSMSDGSSPNPLSTALLAHRKTLKELRLDCGIDGPHLTTLGLSLSGFTALTTLELCETSFGVAIKKPLPHTLETFIIRHRLLSTDTDRVKPLRYFGRKVMATLPNLKEVQAKSTRLIDDYRSEKPCVWDHRPGWCFRVRGVRFSLLTIGDPYV